MMRYSHYARRIQGKKSNNQIKNSRKTFQNPYQISVFTSNGLHLISYTDIPLKGNSQKKNLLEDYNWLAFIRIHREVKNPFQDCF